MKADREVIQLFHQAARAAGYCERIGCQCPVDLQPTAVPDSLPAEPAAPSLTRAAAKAALLRLLATFSDVDIPLPPS